MPSFFKNKNDKIQLKSWWRQLKPFQRNKKTTHSNSSSNTTLDWRSLSPDRPPLPFFTSNSNNQNDNYIIDSPTIDNSLSKDTTSEKIKKLNNQRKPSVPLFPILEESETMITEASHSNLQPNQPPISSNSSVSTSLPSPPLVTSALMFETAEPTTVVQKSPSDRFIPKDSTGNEKLCKRKFAKMVLAAYKYQKESYKDQPTEMNLVFNAEGNIDMMRLIKKGNTSEYHKFVGNSQYVPPELSTQAEYQSEMADVWVLGIFLYRMLVGKYPFTASNDKQLFTKMLHADFSIPNDLSTDAKDLIRRMLAPDSSRASLDLIIHHPWLLSYRHLLLEKFATIPTTNKSIASETSPPPLLKKKRKNPLKKAFLLMMYGPFPPPSKPYQDLAHLGTRSTVFNKHL